MVFFFFYIQHVHSITLPPLSVMQLFVDTLYTNIGKSFWKKINILTVCMHRIRSRWLLMRPCFKHLLLLVSSHEGYTHQSRRKVAKFSLMLSVYDLWAGRDLYRATRIGTRNPGLRSQLRNVWRLSQSNIWDI